MSAHPPPPPPPYDGAPGRVRPRAGWFVAAAGLLVLGVALGVVTLVRSVSAFGDTEATVQPGETETVRVEAGRTYLVWARPGQGDSCRISDQRTGEVDAEGLGSTSYSRTSGGSSWEGSRTFEPTSDSVEITCGEQGGPIQVGLQPRFLGVVDGVLGAVVLPVLLAVAGFVMLLLVSILFATGARRPRAA